MVENWQIILAIIYSWSINCNANLLFTKRRR